MNFGLLSLLDNPLALLVAFASIAFGLVLHNVAQAWLAARFGEQGPARFGFMTLEPRVHLDILSIVFLVLLGFAFPRPVPYRLYGPKAAQVALMGPLALFGAAFIFTILSRLMSPLGMGLEGIALGFQVAALRLIIHAAIFLFPIPPMDGAQVVYALGSASARRFMDQLASYGPMGFLIIFLVLSITGVTGAVSVALYSLMDGFLGLIGL